jgi:hypothetical protein
LRGNFLTLPTCYFTPKSCNVQTPTTRLCSRALRSTAAFPRPSGGHWSRIGPGSTPVAWANCFLGYAPPTAVNCSPDACADSKFLARDILRQLVAYVIWSLARSTDPDVVGRSAGSVYASGGFGPSLGPDKSNYSRGKSPEMVDINLLSLARDLRARAQEILARAETMYDTDAEQTMRQVAARHEKLAQRVEQGFGSAGM